MDLIQLKTRPVVIRRELFDHYSELGLDEQDLVILIKLLYASETSNKQPSIEFLQKRINYGTSSNYFRNTKLNSKRIIRTQC
ncbi:hypothetical protein ACO2E3_03525 [Staphylococcus epidermidis]